jgi:hypothetical protein
MAAPQARVGHRKKRFWKLKHNLTKHHPPSARSTSDDAEERNKRAVDGVFHNPSLPTQGRTAALNL